MSFSKEHVAIEDEAVTVAAVDEMVDAKVGFTPETP